MNFHPPIESFEFTLVRGQSKLKSKSHMGSLRRVFQLNILGLLLLSLLLLFTLPLFLFVTWTLDSDKCLRSLFSTYLLTKLSIASLLLYFILEKRKLLSLSTLRIRGKMLFLILDYSLFFFIHFPLKNIDTCSVKWKGEMSTSTLVSYLVRESK